MKNRNVFISILLALAGATGAQAAQFTYGTFGGSSLAGFNGQTLASTDTVEIGTYVNGTFNSLYSNVSTNLDVSNPKDGVDDPGFFFYQNVAKQDTSAIETFQLAFRWSHAATNTWAIIYVDIDTPGLDASIRREWSVKSGDGSGSDTNTNAIDISHLTTGSPDYNTLRDGAVLINASFTGTNLVGAPYFQIIPEPSTYAAFAGLIALAGVVLYRRR